MGWNYKPPRIRTGNVVERAIVNGWTFAGIYAVRTGNPFTVTISGDRSLTDSRTQQRAFLWQPQLGAADDPHQHRVDKVAEWFNLEAFKNPTPVCTAPTTTQPVPVCTYVYGQPNYGTLGNVGRNSLYGPAYQQISTSVRRDLQFTGSVHGMLRADAFNVFNTPNLAQPQASVFRIQRHWRRPDSQHRRHQRRGDDQWSACSTFVHPALLTHCSI